MFVRAVFLFLGLSLVVTGIACDEEERGGPGACVIHIEGENPFHRCEGVSSPTHCSMQVEFLIGDDDDYSYIRGKTCEEVGFKYCEFNGCIEGGEGKQCQSSFGKHMYASSACDDEVPPSEVDCTGGVFHGVWYSMNPNGTLKAHWDFDQCRVVSWDGTGTICGFHVHITSFEFTGVGSDNGTVVVGYGDYYNWSLCGEDADWVLDATAPKGEQQPIPWELVSDEVINLNGEMIYKGREPAGKMPPAWGGPGKKPKQDPCGFLPEVSCRGS